MNVDDQYVRNADSQSGRSRKRQTVVECIIIDVRSKLNGTRPATATGRDLR